MREFHFRPTRKWRADFAHRERRTLIEIEGGIYIQGRLSDHPKASNTPWEAVRQAQVNLARGDPLGARVDCDDLNNKERKGAAFDDLHYTEEGYELLGRRYARQAKALIEGRKPAENGRP